MPGPPLTAQHGHPLVGSWSGDWGPDPAHRTRLLLTLNFGVDQVISGFIFENGVRIPLQSATLDPDTWTVTMTAQRSDSDGNTIDYFVRGAIGELSSSTLRTITGDWTEGNVSGDFRLTIN